ncbi:hypothetical protein STENM36S_03293 [Streptomyces tendae]
MSRTTRRGCRTPSASLGLPQIIKAAGAKYLLTQKISWSQTNKFPHHTFRWEGIDGTRIFTHFPPVDTYNCSMKGSEIAHAAKNFKDKGVARHSLAPTGWGDGGGGTTREMVAKAARLRDLEGSATVEWETPHAFFEKAEAENPEPPVWVGELYLELHRATLTSQAKTKQGNRRSEHLLREAELWAATAAVRAGFPYPYDDLDRIWKTVLLHQFHDILPGSSIAWVHREARATYDRVAAELNGIIDAAQRALAGEGDTPLVFNSAPHARAWVPAGAAAAPATEDRTRLTPRPGGGHVLDNGLLRVEIDDRGLVVSAYDLAADRETIAPGGAGNLLQLHPDFPNMRHAWDVDEFYRNTVTDLTDADEVAPGDDGASVRIVRSFGSSRVTQVLTLAPGERRLEVDTEVDWHETEKFLKLAFPLDVHAVVRLGDPTRNRIHPVRHQESKIRTNPGKVGSMCDGERAPVTPGRLARRPGPDPGAQPHGQLRLGPGRRSVPHGRPGPRGVRPAPGGVRRAPRVVWRCACPRRRAAAWAPSSPGP